MIVSTRRAEALTIDTRNINRLSFLKVRDGGRASQGYPGILAVLFVSSMRCRGVDGVKTFTLVFRIQRGGVQFGVHCGVQFPRTARTRFRPSPHIETAWHQLFNWYFIFSTLEALSGLLRMEGHTTAHTKRKIQIPSDQSRLVLISSLPPLSTSLWLSTKAPSSGSPARLRSSTIPSPPSR